MQKNRVMLVADDIDVNRASFRAMFEEEYEVLEAGNGNETLKILEERKVDIVILDMCMPVKSGKQVLKQMKADPKLLDIPVIVKTVIGEERELEMLEMGADDFIFSPCEPEVVKKRVFNIMTRYETLAERLESQRHLSTVREHASGAHPGTDGQCFGRADCRCGRECLRHLSDFGCGCGTDLRVQDNLYGNGD